MPDDLPGIIARASFAELPYADAAAVAGDLAARMPAASHDLRFLAAWVLTHPLTCPDAVLLVAEGIHAAAQMLRIDDADDRQVRHTAVLASYVADQAPRFTADRRFP